MKQLCKFEFNESVDPKLIEEEIVESILTTEDIFGQPKVQLNLAYFTFKNKAVIDVSDEIGEHVFSIFIGRLNRRIGRNRYSFQRIPAKN